MCALQTHTGQSVTRQTEPERRDDAREGGRRKGGRDDEQRESQGCTEAQFGLGCHPPAERETKELRETEVLCLCFLILQLQQVVRQ